MSLILRRALVAILVGIPAFFLGLALVYVAMNDWEIRREYALKMASYTLAVIVIAAFVKGDGIYEAAKLNRRLFFTATAAPLLVVVLAVLGEWFELKEDIQVRSWLVTVPTSYFAAWLLGDRTYAGAAGWLGRLRAR